MLNRFGAGALLFRITDLCTGCPREFYDHLIDFRENWQRLEVQRVHASNKDVDMFAAFRLYYMSVIMDAPAVIPSSKADFFTLISGATFASHWNCVLALWHIGAFRELPA